MPPFSEIIVILRLMYVSQVRIAHLSDDGVNELVQKAIIKNLRLGITGSIIFTGSYFAQSIEGKAREIRALYCVIVRDQRHQNITCIDYRRISRLSFPTWRLSYFGAATYVSEPIKLLLHGRDHEGQAQQRLRELLSEFSRCGSPQV